MSCCVYWTDGRTELQGQSAVSPAVGHGNGGVAYRRWLAASRRRRTRIFDDLVRDACRLLLRVKPVNAHSV